MPNYGVTIQHGYGGSLTPMCPERGITYLITCAEGENPALVAAQNIMRKFPEDWLDDRPNELVERWSNYCPPIIHGIRQAESLIITER